jgi:ATP-dependent DNA helicase RecG
MTKRDENQDVEYKESWHDKYLERICGCANANGGTLHIGD